MKSSIEKQSRLDTQAHHEMWAGVEGGMRLWTGDESVSQQGRSQRGAPAQISGGSQGGGAQIFALNSTHLPHSAASLLHCRHNTSSQGSTDTSCAPAQTTNIKDWYWERIQKMSIEQATWTEYWTG